MVAGTHHRHERVQVRTGTSVRLKNVPMLDLAVIELDDLVLELRRALNPTVVHLLRIEHLVKRGALLTVERAQLPHGERRDGRLGDIPGRVHLVDVQPILDSDNRNVHSRLLFLNS